MKDFLYYTVLRFSMYWLSFVWILKAFTGGSFLYAAGAGLAFGIYDEITTSKLKKELTNEQ